MKRRIGPPTEEEQTRLRLYIGTRLYRKIQEVNLDLEEFGLELTKVRWMTYNSLGWNLEHYSDKRYPEFEEEELHRIAEKKALAEAAKNEAPLQGLEGITAKGIKEYLDKYVIKQDRAKKILSAELSSHYRRIQLKPKEGETKSKKKNILLLGSTGVGKSYLVEKIAEKMKVPFAKVDATSYTAAGYVGGDVEDIVRVNLLNNAKGNVKAAEKGIVYIDEFDKVSASRGGHGPDVGGDKVQTALLALIEGKEIEVTPSWRKSGGFGMPSKTEGVIDTKDILFIVGGSFSFGSDGSLADLIKDRKKQKISNIGFGAEVQEKQEDFEDYEFLKDVTPQDLMKFGMRPEIVGRFQAIVPLENLDKDDLVKILTKDAEDSIIRQYENEFSNLGISLSFEEEALYAIAEKAAVLKTGARSLELIMFQTLFDYRFELEGIKEELKVTKAMVEDPAGELKKKLKEIELSK